MAAVVGFFFVWRSRCRRKLGQLKARQAHGGEKKRRPPLGRRLLIFAPCLRKKPETIQSQTIHKTSQWEGGF
ncbi:hypothetical protein [Pandoravirus japonicus]|uniref:Uncharacterized protein n=1 Tax=Pandoravirus japonicus TaxID=2823154 RepID=A0A811BNS7_9VIRU|nr:hypothetical protein [Pandoravirus japonicus]